MLPTHASNSPATMDSRSKQRRALWSLPPTQRRLYRPPSANRPRLLSRLLSWLLPRSPRTRRGRPHPLRRAGLAAAAGVGGKGRRLVLRFHLLALFPKGLKHLRVNAWDGDTVEHHRRRRGRRGAAGRRAARAAEGHKGSQALRRHSPAFTRLYVQSVQAGERWGALRRYRRS